MNAAFGQRAYIISDGFSSAACSVGRASCDRKMLAASLVRDILKQTYGVRFHNFDSASAAFSKTRFCRHSAVSNWARNGILRSKRALARVQRVEDCLRSRTVNAAAKSC